MLNSYINNINVMLLNALFFCFKYSVIIFVTLLILSLLLLGIGCLIKSQKIKSKFLIIVPSLTAGTIFLITIPYIVMFIKNLI